MTNELDAAIERYRSCGTDPNTRWVNLRCDDAFEIADAALPLFSTEPITEEALRAMGFVLAPWNDERRWELTICNQYHEADNGTTRHWLIIHEPQDDWWPIDFRQQFEDDKHDGVALLSHIDRTTVGHVRMLVESLRGGISAPPDTKGGD